MPFANDYGRRRVRVYHVQFLGFVACFMHAWSLGGTHLLLENVGSVAVQLRAVGGDFVLELLDTGLLGGLLFVVVGFLPDETVGRLGRDVES